LNSTHQLNQAHQAGNLAEFGAGARDTIPMMVGAAPFGVIFGTLAATGPLHAWSVQLMSLAVFAGSAQFIALGLIAGHASFAVIWATTFIVNLRHVLYSATLAPYVAHLPARWRWTLGAFMTDINLGIYTAQLDLGNSISATSEKLSIRHHTFENVRFKDFLRGLLAADLRAHETEPRPAPPRPQEFVPQADAPVTIARLFERLNAFIGDDTIVIADVGNALFGAMDLFIHKRTEFLGPAYYASMGFAVPAALGSQGTFVAINNVVSQSVPHLHTHVVPRTKGDGLRGFFWPRHRYGSDEEASSIAALIAKELG